MDNKYLEDYLKKYGISYLEFKHKPVFTVEESEKIKQKIPGLRTKSLFLKSGEKYFLVCMPGHKRLDIKNLKKHLNIKELHFARPEELLSELKAVPGSVSLFCLINSRDTILILDREVYNAQESGFHPNKNTSTIVLGKDNLLKFFNSLPNKKEIWNG